MNMLRPELTIRPLLLAASLLLLSAAVGCSFIEFERGPYAVRGVDVVYSIQEDLTFIVWRLSDEASPDRVSFELFLEGHYQPLDLAGAPYPAEPYGCDRRYLCFQYQLHGRYDIPAGIRPVRSIHERHGLIEGTPARRHEALRTFGVNPIGLERNRTLDPRRYDWFVAHKIPLKRQYQWQLVDAAPTSDADMREQHEAICARPGSSWQPMFDRISVPHSWVERPRCMAARPIRSDGQGVTVTVPFLPSAEVVWERQDYVPPGVSHPTIYAFLFDMQVRNSSRCAQIKRTLATTVADATTRVAAERPHPVRRLGPYTPVDPVAGEDLDGCSQIARQDYPVTRMIEDVKDAAEDFGDEDVRVVWIYVNNVELPPSERLLRQLFELEMLIADEPRLHSYPWAIGSNFIMSAGPWSWATGWRPIEDETFIGDLKAFADYNLPFRTMRHDTLTDVRIRPLEGVTRPMDLRICQTTVTFDQLRLGPDLYFGPWDRAFPWPDDDQLHYRVFLPPQDMVPFQEYRRVTNSVVVEVCERFCDNPFRTRAGLDFLNWRDSGGRCQWG
jgi:hypothetical protein